MSTGISRIADSLLLRRLGQRTAMSNRFSPSTMFETATPPRALATTLLTSDCLDAPTLAFVGIDAPFHVRLAADIEDADILDAADLLQGRPGPRSEHFQLVEIRPHDFDRVVAFDSGEGLQDVVADVLGKIPRDAGQFAIELVVEHRHELILRSGSHAAENPLPPARFFDRLAASPSPAARERNTRCCSSRRCRWRRPAGRAGSRSTRPPDRGQ